MHSTFHVFLSGECVCRFRGPLGLWLAGDVFVSFLTGPGFPSETSGVGRVRDIVTWCHSYWFSFPLHKEHCAKEQLSLSEGGDPHGSQSPEASLESPNESGWWFSAVTVRQRIWGVLAKCILVKLADSFQICDDIKWEFSHFVGKQCLKIVVQDE